MIGWLLHRLDCLVQHADHPDHAEGGGEQSTDRQEPRVVAALRDLARTQRARDAAVRDLRKAHRLVEQVDRVEELVTMPGRYNGLVSDVEQSMRRRRRGPG